MTAAAYDLATTSVLLRRDLVRFFRQPSRLVGALGQPVLFWLIIGSGMAATFRMPGSGVGYQEYFYPGVVVMVVLFASIFSTVSLIEDRHHGFLQAVLAGPGSRASVVLGKSLGGAAVALSQVALFLLLAPLAGLSWTGIDWPLLLAALGLVSVGLAAFGFLIAWWLDNIQGYHAVQMTLLLPLWVLSGAMFPAGEHPAMTAVMRWNPLSYAVAATRAALGSSSPGAPGASLSLAVLTLFAALSLGGAIWICERRR
jgi:daunorubicin resistance ABC transporter membrane protein